MVEDTLKSTVPIRIITSKQYAALVPVHDNIICPDGLNGGTIAKVLPVYGALIAPPQNVRFGVISQRNGLVQTSLDLQTLSGIAALVDRVLIHGASIPWGQRLMREGLAVAGPGMNGGWDGDGRDSGEKKEGDERGGHRG